MSNLHLNMRRSQTCTHRTFRIHLSGFGSSWALDNSANVKTGCHFFFFFIVSYRVYNAPFEVLLPCTWLDAQRTWSKPFAEVPSCRRRWRGAVCFMFYLGLFNVRVPSLSVLLLSPPSLVFTRASRLCSVVHGGGGGGSGGARWSGAVLILPFDKQQPSH